MTVLLPIHYLHTLSVRKHKQLKTEKTELAEDLTEK